jgi:hypothetical protein
VVVYAYNPSTTEAEAGESWVPSQSEPPCEILSQNSNNNKDRLRQHLLAIVIAQANVPSEIR